MAPVKGIIYCNQLLKLYNQYNKMTKLGLKVIGIKTDCIFYTGNTKLVYGNFDFSNEIGKYKLESNKYLSGIQIIVNVNYRQCE